jgi:hypothetical protein
MSSNYHPRNNPRIAVGQCGGGVQVHHRSMNALAEEGGWEPSGATKGHTSWSILSENNKLQSINCKLCEGHGLSICLDL